MYGVGGSGFDLSAAVDEVVSGSGGSDNDVADSCGCVLDDVDSRVTVAARSSTDVLPISSKPAFLAHVAKSSLCGGCQQRLSALGEAI